ncbi:hypothetical protein [Ammonifex thiophilus]|uniref:hypothetical protein n=1 Tax=Ammonifex thiophilus TaxID=444093 RepID=UPI0014038FB8|nr:hypothetical protein [Ammonifex thiophilus]
MRKGRKPGPVQRAALGLTKLALVGVVLCAAVLACLALLWVLGRVHGWLCS